ncbi:hypothetical protein Hrd1104_07360 [Halorhabdus sp. CBA1104]|nr:hypothetical protein Hrd1104_07360 [Halorhabdus sp. CBA1104]
MSIAVRSIGPIGPRATVLRWPAVEAMTWARSARRRRDDRADVHPSAAGSDRAAERSVVSVYVSGR